MYKIILAVFCLSLFAQSPICASTDALCVRVLKDFNESSPLLTRLDEIAKKNSDRRAWASRHFLTSFFNSLFEAYGPDAYQAEINKALNQNPVYSVFRQFTFWWAPKDRAWSRRNLEMLNEDVQKLERLGYNFWNGLSADQVLKSLTTSNREGVEASLKSRIASVARDFEEMDRAARNRIRELMERPRKIQD